MFRRFVSVLLLPCFLLSQSAALGHSHGSGQPAGHDSRPHIHTNLAATGHKHSHHHGPGHHHDLAAAPDKPIAAPERQPESPRDHDSDALFVDATDAVAAPRSQSHVNGDESSLFSACDITEVFGRSWAGGPAPHSRFCGLPPPYSSSICPIYIRHLALLI